jgi:hypothetical protein
MSKNTTAILAEVAAERERQDSKWGEQNHPDGTGGAHQRIAAAKAKRYCDAYFEQGVGDWRLILTEEVAEAFAESDPARLRGELIQVAAVAVSWAEAIDRRLAAKEES